MMRAARKELGLATSQTIMIGDTMATDILGGVQMGYRSILVLGGTTRESDLASYAYGPHLVLDSVAELADPARDVLKFVPPGDLFDDSVHDIDEGRRAHE